MKAERTLFVGFDLCNDYSQLTCYNEKTFEPETITISEDENGFIPTVLFVKEDTGEWLFGEDAVQYSQNKEGLLVEHFIKKIMDKEEIIVYDASFHGAQILEKYIKKVLGLLKPYYPNESIRSITITIRKVDVNLVKAIYEALENLGILKDRARVVSHEQSYLYYALSQKKELWMNDVGLFELNEEGLSYHQITINRKLFPMPVTVTHKDFRETLGSELVEENDTNSIEYIFLNIANGVLHKHIVSALYLTGTGFLKDWKEEVFKNLCVGRRLFIGQNLYTRGACLAAKECVLKENGAGKLNDFLFLCEEMIPCSISIKIYMNGKIEEVVLAKEGIPWYEVDTQLALIPDLEENIVLILRNSLKRKTEELTLNIGIIEGRCNKMTRLEIRLYFIDEKTGIMTVKDRGFGEYYQTSNRIWEKMIPVLY